MQSDATREVTLLLQDADRQESAQRLLSLVYDQLRAIARQRMAEERADHTLQPTEQVHEAYLRLTGGADVSWQNRAHFFAAAVEAMRRILIEHARRKAGPKQGGRLKRRALDEIDVAGAAGGGGDDLLALDEALADLERHDAQAAALVKLRYFGGFGHQEAAELLGLSRRQADRLWALSRAWLYRRIRE